MKTSVKVFTRLLNKPRLLKEAWLMLPSKRYLTANSNNPLKDNLLKKVLNKSDSFYEGTS
jgi:hypothetical protein